MTSKLLRHLAASPEAIRMETLDGKEYMVVPTIAIVEGILHSSNSAAPELALAEEFGKFPEGWDGRPVLIDHPKANNGQPIPANSTELWDDQIIGQLFNTKLDGDKLKTEAWIDIEKAKELGYEDELARLESGETVEVSTGLFTDSVEKSGLFHGESFAAIWDNVVPDHLAILPEGSIGACSVEDGCGAPRLNSTVSPCDCGNNPCTCKAPNALRKPVQNIELTLEPSSVEKIIQRIKASLGFAAAENDIDKRRAIEAALGATEDFFFIHAVEEDSVIIEKGWSGELVKRSFAIEEDGSVTLGKEEISVRPVTQFVDVRLNEKEIEMPNITKKVDELVANASTRFTDKDKEWLVTLSEEQLSQLEPLKASQEKEAEDGDAGQEDEDNVAANAAAAPVTTESFISQAPADIQEVLREGLRLQSSRRAELIKVISANERNKFSEETLKDMDSQTLENLAQIAAPSDFTGAAPSIQSAADDPNAPAKMPSLKAALAAHSAA